MMYTPRQVKKALRQANIKIAGEIPTHFMVYCVFHQNFRTAAAEVSKTTGQFYCFACRETCSLPDLVAGQLKTTYFGALRIIGDDEYNIVEELDSIFVDEGPGFNQSVIDQLCSDVDGRGREYLNSRLITDDSIEYFELGYSAKQDMVTWPVHNGLGELKGLVGRSVTGKVFKNSKGLKKSMFLYNLHRAWTNNVVYVVEASFNVMRLHQAGLPAVATLGAGVSHEQVNLLQKSFDSIIVIQDDDVAGNRMVEKIRAAMPSTESIILPQDFQYLSDYDLAAILPMV